MGFLDKAKKLADQAQTKLDEVQKDFNKGGSGTAGSGGPALEYDEHGRPVSATPPVAPGAPAAPAAPAPPADRAPTPDPSSPTSPDAEPAKRHGDPLLDGEPGSRHGQAPPSSSGGSGFTSGDPLAG